MIADPARGDDPPLRVGFVPGVTPDKWARTWAERMPSTLLELFLVEPEQQTAVLYDGRAEMCFVRLPVDPAHREGLHVIPLYSEVPVVVAAKGHFVEAADVVTTDDLADEHFLEVPPLTMREAVETIAAGTGVIVVPMSVARLHHRRDVVHRRVVDASETRVGLAWRRDVDDDRVEAFIGVVRGRTANSSRGPLPTGSRDRTGKVPSAGKTRSSRRSGRRGQGRRRR